MSVVTGGLGSLAPKLLQLLRDEYKLQTGVRKQVQWLHSELESIHAFLCKVSDVPWDQLDQQIKVWAREVREASYDMEDVLDTFLVSVDGGEPADPSRLKCAMKKIGKVFSKAKARRSIAGAIEGIKKHLEEISQRRQKYKLDELILSNRVTMPSTIDPRLTAMYREVTQLIGVDKSSDELISIMNPAQPGDDLSSKKITQKVSIVGVGGLGKTTLAKAVYDKLKPQFDCAAFVSIGRDYDLVKVFKDILFDLDKEKYGNIHNTGRGIELLIRELREFLQNKRYFVVIDDVWDVPTWNIIKIALVDNNCGSKVVTTTRKFDVAEEAGEIYNLKPLSTDSSMKLFYARIFGAEEKYLDNQPDDVADKIIKKCGGIPLAIITLASLLAGKQKYEWSEVVDSIGFGRNGNREVEDTMKIISFSYYDLSPHLKTCLLYLSTYPEDYLIEKDPLIWKWIAEGFINEKHGTSLFELGERYFNDLINRSLIQAPEDKWNGRVSRCRVHDMVLDMVRMLSFEENFVVLFGDNNDQGTPTPSNVRRLAIHNPITKHIDSGATISMMRKVRSYTVINSQVQFSSFNLLRLVDIVECRFMYAFHYEHLCDLLQLRYLGIRRCGYLGTKLPIQIENLKFLQTIHLDGFGMLPATIVQLTQLVRLCASDMEAPDRIGNMTCLEELIIRGNTKGFMKELCSLGELRVLKVQTQAIDESTQRDFVQSLCNLKKIQSIHVVSFGLSKADTTMWEAAGFVLPRPLCYLDLCFHFTVLPSWINPTRLPNLSHLTLRGTTMDEQDLKLLARLPVLCSLNLETESTITASSINVGDDFFQKLRCFTTKRMVQFEQPNKKDARVSMHIWNGKDAVPFSSRKSNDTHIVVPCGVMPNLEVLKFQVPLRALKDSNGDYGDIGLEYLPSLHELWGLIHCDGVAVTELGAVFDALRNACEVHPNKPFLSIDLMGQPIHDDVSPEDEEDEEGDSIK